MGCEMTSAKSAIQKELEEQMKRMRTVMIRTLKKIGEDCVNIAREKGAYINRTGNLRSSTGYVIVADGAIVSESSFEVVDKGSEGAAEGLAYARNLASNFPTDYALIVVAGKNYAIHVENRGFNVLAKSKLYAQKIAPKMIEQLRKM